MLFPVFRNVYTAYYGERSLKNFRPIVWDTMVPFFGIQWSHCLGYNCPIVWDAMVPLFGIQWSHCLGYNGPIVWDKMVPLFGIKWSHYLG